MSGIIQYDRMFKVTGPDGTVLWQGAGQLGQVFHAYNISTSAVINEGEAVGVSVGAAAEDLVIPRFDYAATAIPPTEQVAVVRTTVTIASLIGVALTRMPVNPTTKNPITCDVAGVGSIIGVKSLASGSITVNALGAAVARSATAGSVTALTLLPTTAQPFLGCVVKPAGVAAGQTGSDTVLGVLIGGLPSFTQT